MSNYFDEDYTDAEFDGLWDDLDVAPVATTVASEGTTYNPDNINDWEEGLGPAGFDTHRGLSLIENPITIHRFEAAF